MFFWIGWNVNYLITPKLTKNCVQFSSDLDITPLDARAPEPILSVGVRQAGELVTGELNVSPGTPLSMEIYLDKASAPVYGLGVTYMQVTDMKSQEETIIFNGFVCIYIHERFDWSIIQFSVNISR